ncbi:MAG: DNA primase, partial [Dasania sp.]
AKAKYLNGSETEIFKKSAIVYNVDKITHQRSSMPDLVVCEGYMDVIALGCHGFKNCVAPMGTALTDAQIKILWRYHNEPILCFDGDKAGLNAACRAAHKVLDILTAGYSLRFCFLPDGLDPDDYLKKHGKDSFKQILDNAVPLSSVLFAQAAQDIPPTTPERRAGLEKELFSIANQITDERLKKLYQSDLFSQLNRFVTVQSPQSSNAFKRQSKSNWKKQYYDPSLSVQQSRNITEQEKNDSSHYKEFKIIGLYIHFLPYLTHDDFDLFAKLSFDCTEKQGIQGAILNIFLKNRNKILENHEKMDNIPFDQFDLETETLWQLPPNICQSDTYQESLLATQSIESIKMSPDSRLINLNDRINKYRNIFYDELNRTCKEILSGKKGDDLFTKLLSADTSNEKTIEQYSQFKKSNY